MSNKPLLESEVLKKKKVQASSTRIKPKACLLREKNKENLISNLEVGLQNTVSRRDN